jgi:hypothetical protein
MGLIRAKRVVALCLWGMIVVAGPAGAAEIARPTPDDLLRSVQVLEREAASAAGSDRARVLESKMTELSRAAAQRLARETGIRLSTNTSLPGVRGQEINRWIGALNERTEGRRCDLVRVAYALAISRLALLKPSPTGQHVDRALNELRLFWALKPDAPYAPRNCMSPHSPDRSIASEAQLRINSLETTAQDPRS